MKVHLSAWTWTIAGVLLTSTANAQNEKPVSSEDERPVNRFALSYRPGFNISAKFKNAGGFAPGADPGPARSGANHNYENGYNRVDSSGNTGQGACEDCTWYWGYNRAGQISGNGQFLSMSSSAQEAETDADEEVGHGAELIYQRELGQIGRFYWGLEGVFNYMTLDLEEDVTLEQTTDRYSLVVGGVTVVPPLPPYHGSVQGPGPVISDIPIRSIQRSPGGKREFDADIYGFRFGPYFEWPFANKWALHFSGGLAMASINSDFSFTDTRSGARASDDDSDWNFGGYASGTILYNLKSNIDIFAGAQFQHLGDYTHKLSGNKAELDLGGSVFAVLGMGFSF